MSSVCHERVAQILTDLNRESEVRQGSARGQRNMKLARGEKYETRFQPQYTDVNYCCFQKSWHSHFDITFLVICGLKQRIILTH